MESSPDCYTAPLHLVQQVQAHGAVLVVNDQNIIVGVSANAQHFFGINSRSFLGASCSELLPELADILRAPDQPGSPGRNTRLWQVQIRDVVLAVATHRNGALRFLEFEMPEPNRRHLTQGSRDALFEQFLVELEETQSAKGAALALLDHVADIVEFDRAMLIQKMFGGHYHVIGEIRKPGIDSYLNHCFPGTDIPPNAESLYLKKRQRFIANAEQDPVPLLSNSDHPLDLTGAELRQVHPVHRQYMRNMGTASSFSVSIVVNKALWGMVVCHNYRSTALSFQARQMCMHKANIAGLHMQSLVLQRATLRRHRQENLLRQLRQELFSQPFNPASARVGLHFLLRIFRASGAFLVHNYTWYRLGKMPDSVVCSKLRCWLSENQVQPLFSTDTVIPELADQANFTRLASGVLSLNYSDDNYLVILRREYRQNRRWAGPPQHSQQQMSSLGPRASFSTWFEQTHGKAVPWSEIDLEAAHDLLRLLAEVTQYRKAERRSLTDPLTGLGNREFMHNQLNAWLESSPAAVARFAVVLLDLDEFKPINDRYGHSVGDQVLVQVAHRLQGCVRGSDHVIRLGGDEFVMLLGGFDDRSNLSELAQRVIQQLQQPYRVNGLSLNVVASMGIALFPDHGRDVAELLKKADEAMYQVKRAGRGTSMLYGDTFL